MRPRAGGAAGALPPGAAVASDEDLRRARLGGVHAGKAVLAIINIANGDVASEIEVSEAGEILNPTWSPDGKELVFMRAPAIDPYDPAKPVAMAPGDPNETQIRFDLYRMPFGEGRGGTPEPIPGAGNNGMSNSFPKVSPDGKWLVYTGLRDTVLDVYKIPIGFSLAVVATFIGISIGMSLRST